MPARLGAAAAYSAARLGGTALTAMRLGSTLVWSATQMRDDFNRDDGALGAAWVLDAKTADYTIVISNELARMGIPDGPLDVSWGEQTARHRFVAAQHPSGDGWLEFRVGHKGMGGKETIVYRRYANSGGASGVGVSLLNSGLSIVRRLSGSNTVMQDCGDFVNGDVCRLVQAGNLHTLYRNGEFAGEWNDTGGTALNGSDNRSMGMSMQGEKALFSPRSFSPALDYVECG